MKTCLFLLAIVQLSLSGCRSAVPRPIAADGSDERRVEMPSAPAERVGDSPAGQNAAPDTPTVLTHKVSNYAQEIEKALKQRNALPPDRSRVAWTDTSPAEPAAGFPTPAVTSPSRATTPATPKVVAPVPPIVSPRSPATEHPTVQTNEAPAQKALATPLNPRTAQHVEVLRQGVKSTGLNDMPAIVPEGEEGVANTSSRTLVTADAVGDPIATRMKDSPSDVSAQLDYQLSKFLHDEPVPQASPLAALSGEDREVISTLMDGLSNFRSGVRAESNMLLSRKVRPLLEMSDRLRSQAELSVPTIALCRRVDGFGVYEPIEPARFPAGREQPVIVYCEVENFASQLNDQKKWETRLQQQAVLFTETGLPVWQDKPRNIVDLSRNRRHDFFVIKVMKLPANLSIGRYLLKVSLVDQQVKRVAEATLPVQIVAE